MDLRRIVARFLEARKYTKPKNMIPVLNTDTERVVYILPETLKQESGKYKKIPPSKLNTEGKPAPRRPGQPHMPKRPRKPHRPEIPRDPPPAPIHPPIPPKHRLPPKKPKPVPELKPPKVPEPSPPHRWKKVKRFLYGFDVSLMERISVRFVAPKSVGTKPGPVLVEGIGRLYAEPPDGDDTFPPAIAHYRVVDGWLVYEGRDGSQGVIVGRASDLTRWMRDVDKAVRDFPLHRPRPWIESDGGQDNLEKARRAASRVYPGIRLEFLSSENNKVEGWAGTSQVTVVNAHLDQTTEVGGQRFHAGSAVAAHEAAHMAYQHNAAAGKRVTGVLAQQQERVSLYHGLAGHFEGTMDAAAWWALSPSTLKSKMPQLFEAIQSWLG